MIPKAKIQRSVFSRDHDYKTTFDSGYLIPFYCDEALPGDTFKVKTSIFCRLTTPIVPFMDNLFLDTFYFAVPNRLVWDNWQRFMGERKNPDDSIDYLVPNIDLSSGCSVGSIYDYFGVPTGVKNLEINAFFCRAYNLIYNEWFRDENLIDSVDVPTDDGPDDPSIYTLLKRGKRHDYFTSCLPWPQKGDSVSLTSSFNGDVNFDYDSSTPFTLRAQNGIIDDINLVIPFDRSSFTSNGGSTTNWANATEELGNTITYYNYMNGSEKSRNHYNFYETDSGNYAQATTPLMPFNNKDMAVTDSSVLLAGDDYAFYTDVSASLSSSYDNYVSGYYYGSPAVIQDLGISGTIDLSDSSLFSINDLRNAYAVQALLERDARGGTRYTEIIRSHFGVISPDARLQRPEFLGGSSQRINVVPVPQTSSSDSDSPQGNLAAFGLCASNKNAFYKSFTEHSVIIGLMCVRASLTYQQGLNRMFSRDNRYSYYWPELAHLGEQAVLNQEIYAQGTEEDTEVFGYQERYAEYRYYPSLITGQFRSTYSNSLDFWHLAQEFESLPTLSQDFIEENPPLERVLAVTDYPQLLADVHFKVRAVRPMPVYGVPYLSARF